MCSRGTKTRARMILYRELSEQFASQKNDTNGGRNEVVATGMLRIPNIEHG